MRYLGGIGHAECG